MQPFSKEAEDPSQAFRKILAAGKGSSSLDAVAFAVALFPASKASEWRILLVFGESRGQDSKAAVVCDAPGS